MKAKTQLEAIEKHLIEKGEITSQTANKEYGVSRLSDKILVLRRKMNIKTEMIKTKNRFGNHVEYGNYKLIK